MIAFSIARDIHRELRKRIAKSIASFLVCISLRAGHAVNGNDNVTFDVLKPIYGEKEFFPQRNLAVSH